MLKNVSANILVATAMRGSIPNENITGTVMRELLPVITPIMLVRKKTITSMTCSDVSITTSIKRIS
jgi:hypothetical protein